MANVTVSGVDVTVTSEGFGGKDIPAWKMLGVFQEADASAWDTSFCEFISKDFTDWTSTDLSADGQDFSSYLETGPQLFENPLSDKQGVYIDTFLSKTSKTQTVGGFYEVPTRSSSLYSDTWSTLTSPRADGITIHAGGSVSDRYLIYCGGDTSGGDAVTETWVYDSVSDTWDQGADVPTLSSNTGRESFYGEGVGDYLYVCGGITNENNTMNRLDRYDPATDTWTQLANAPAAHMSGDLISDGTYIYSGFAKTQAGAEILNLWRYEIGADTWSTLDVDFNPIDGVGSSVYRSWFAGGLYRPGDNFVTPASRNIFQFNFNTNDWDDTGILYTGPLNTPKVVVVDPSKSILFGSVESAQTVCSFVGSTKTSLTSMPIDIVNPVAGKIGDKIYFIGGATGNTNSNHHVPAPFLRYTI